MKQDDSLTSAFGVRMPRIIYGTAWKQERTAALVEQAIETGFRGIDTACQPKHYNEAGVGEGGRRRLFNTRIRARRALSANQIHPAERPRSASSSL